jgi:hypothetical protein
MKNSIFNLTSFFIFFALIACSTGHCRRDGSGKVLEEINAKPPTGFNQEDLGEITVSKPDGSLQCGVRVGMDLDVMAKKELAGVKILSSEKRNDGLMRIQSCGSATGLLNTYTIKHQDLRKAQESGFTVQK